MDEKTRIVLENANAETRHIVIYNDPSLTLEDKKRIAQTVEAVTAAFGERSPDKGRLAGAIKAAYAEAP